jgi:hypothetical protein
MKLNVVTRVKREKLPSFCCELWTRRFGFENREEQFSTADLMPFVELFGEGVEKVCFDQRLFSV